MLRVGFNLKTSLQNGASPAPSPGTSEKPQPRQRGSSTPSIWMGLRIQTPQNPLHGFGAPVGFPLKSHRMGEPSLKPKGRARPISSPGEPGQGFHPTIPKYGFGDETSCSRWECGAFGFSGRAAPQDAEVLGSHRGRFLAPLGSWENQAVFCSPLGGLGEAQSSEGRS